MLRGPRLNAGALEPRMRAQEILSNNIANVQNGGFRRERVAFHTLLDGASGTAFPLQRAVAARDETPSTTQVTGNPLDFALDGPGYFVVMGNDGKERLTRSGAFTLGPDGTIRTQAGLAVVGEGGPITLPPGAVSANDDGTISVDGQVVGTLRVVGAPKESLERAGSNLFVLAEGASPLERPAETRVRSGTLEDSNVEAVVEMVEMMQIVREFEANVKAMEIQSDTLKRLIEQYTRG